MERRTVREKVGSRKGEKEGRRVEEKEDRRKGDM